MKYGIDCTEPPSAYQAQLIANIGWQFCGVYVGGPRAAAHDSWHQVDGIRYPVRDIAGYFSEFVPIYVGRNVGDDPSQPWDPPSRFTFSQGIADGDDANIATGACGFGPNTPLFLDLEYGTWQAHPVATMRYCLGWVQQVNAAGHKAGLYSDTWSIGALGTPDLFDITWGAYQLRSARNLQAVPRDLYDPSDPPPWDMWQFGSGILAGIAIDYNSARDDLVLAKYG